MRQSLRLTGCVSTLSPIGIVVLVDSQCLETAPSWRSVLELRSPSGTQTRELLPALPPSLTVSLALSVCLLSLSVELNGSVQLPTSSSAPINQTAFIEPRQTSELGGYGPPSSFRLNSLPAVAVVWSMLSPCLMIASLW
jgi:hypothetical protein